MQGAPADPLATAGARCVYRRLSSRAARADQRVLIGQYAGWAPEIERHGDAVVRRVIEQTGHRPALIGADYYMHSCADAARTDAVNALLIEQWNAGSLVTLSAHMPNPQAGGSSWDTDVDVDALLDPTSSVHRAMREEADRVAAGLAELRDAGVVVLFRPWHECNGHWFWWGNREPALFHRLWRWLFEHFTREHDLHHLLWIYSPDFSAPRIADYFVGDDCVDLAAGDYYGTDLAKLTTGCAALRTLDKPVGLAEFGPGPAASSDTGGGFDFDHSQLMRWIEAALPEVCFTMNWNWQWGLDRSRGAKQLMEHPWAVTAESLRLPALLAGDR